MHLNSMEDFHREISYHVLKRGDGTISLNASLKDRFHDIHAEIIIDGESLTISSIRAEFAKSPTPECKNVAPRLQRLVGVTVGKGLSRKLAETLGGGEGCGNMRSLLLGLLPLALNVRAAAGITDEGEMLDAISEKLRGTCAGYALHDGRSGGPERT